jgi:GNAT superfamily N-acetyltransferase
MTTLLHIHDPDALRDLETHDALPHFDPDLLERHRTDAHWVARSSSGSVTGRCSLWWTQTPAHHGHQLGLIGHFAVANAVSAGLLLGRACAELAARSCTLAVGPMDGSTWRHYRLMTEGRGEPAFFLEPWNPPDWPRHFIDSGFVALANYFSASTKDLDQVDPKATVAAQRLETLGVTLRMLNLARLDQDLWQIYMVAASSFRGSFLYQPLPESEFLDTTRALRPWLRPELIWIAEHEGSAVGFLFALPDALRGSNGGSIDTAIIKTIAVLPDRRYRGLGSWLTLRSHRAAREAGCRRMIHALMHESNRSRNISARYAIPFRRYTLFARSL